jgi:deoxyribonuclease-4
LPILGEYAVAEFDYRISRTEGPVPLFGAHLSIAGGLHNAVTAAIALDCGTVQLFTKNASQWRAKPLAEDDIRTFRKALSASKLRFATAHDSYLINLATPDDALYRRSIEAFVEEVERAEALGLTYLVMHPGAHMGTSEEAGITRVAAALDEVHRRCSGYRVMVLLEITAGQGTTLGHRFEHLAAIRDRVRGPARLGVCFDTCHAFAAGYRLDESDGYSSTFQEFDATIGLKYLRLFHLNDSKQPLGSRVDRHEGLGRGRIGLETFRRLVNDRRFRDRPMILETPKEDAEGRSMDPVNLRILRKLLKTRKSGDSRRRR